MEKLFNEPILDQMYEFRKETFEQFAYSNNKKIKDGELHICELSENFIGYLERIISDKEQLAKAKKMFSNYELDYEKQIDLWNCTYFKLGMRDREKIRNEFFENKLKTKECDTFLNNKKDEFSEWLEEQKNKYTFETKEYKELQKKYNEISENYPNCIEVFEDLKPINLNIEEIKALIELRKIDIEMGNMEKDLCFKLGMKEIINF